MQIQQGLFNHMVLQRNAKGVSEAAFAGDCTGSGKLLARVARGGKFVRGFDNLLIGRASKGKFRGMLSGLPAGGPYQIALRIEGKGGAVAERLNVSDVLVGDVWILGGQSNMQGCGILKEAEKSDPRVRAFYTSDEWRVAKDPIHDLWYAVDKVHGANGNPNDTTGVGPGVAFGKEMLRRSGVPQGLIACAHGGTSMAQWDPKKRDLGGGSLYGASVRRFKKNGGRIAGIAWYQGESDASPDAAPLYTRNMKELIGSFRKDFKQPDLPFVLVQIGRFVTDNPAYQYWNSVQDQQRRLPKVIKNCSVVAAIDLPLDDLIHVSGAGGNHLGRRIGYAMDVLRRGRKAGLPPITLKRIHVVKNPRSNCGDVVVEFENVAGRLTAPGQPAGFVLSDTVTHGYIYRIDLERNKAILCTNYLIGDVNTKLIHYGVGFAPFCNIVDDADRSLPVFGPAVAGMPRALTQFVQELEVSQLLQSAGKLETLAYPADLSTLGLVTRRFPGTFCDRNAELSARAPEDFLVYYRCQVECPEPMALAVGLGYDGPVKVWVDREEKFHDPDGINPSLPEDARIPVNSRGGKHEILVALGSNKGLADGIFLRFERADLKPSQIKDGPGAYKMPKVVAG